MTLRWGDWAAVAVYFAITLLIGWRAKARQGNATEYFLDGRRTHWIIAGVSLYATLFSTVSFVGMPGEAYKNGVLYGLYSFGYFLFTPLAMWLLLRFFYDTRSFTAYEYLERRYDGRVRTLGALLFLGARLLSGATVLYAAAKIFETLVGWNAGATILIAGVFTIYYCYIGGMRAIMLTDFMQTAVILLGLGCILFKLLAIVGFDLGAVWQTATPHFPISLNLLRKTHDNLANSGYTAHSPLCTMMHHSAPRGNRTVTQTSRTVLAFLTI